MLTQSTEISTIAGELSKSRIWAERPTLRAMVNSYLRETRQFNPMIKGRSEEHTQEPQSRCATPYACFSLRKKKDDVQAKHALYNIVNVYKGG
ncbi:hypothetical protein E4V51_26970, partial [Paenibacillus sp. 28ISP30-2]|nr:hypothetical protein [Paenibacillus sp. 28ISP30-2]